MSSRPALYDAIGRGYDATRRADPYLTGRLSEWLEVGPGTRYLDVGCGTGSYTAALRARGGDWVGIDRSRLMLARSRERRPTIGTALADSAKLPFADGRFGGALCTLASHHFPALLPAFAEVRRVLGAGRFVLLLATCEQTAGYWLEAYFPKMMERSIRATPSRAKTLDALRRAGFARIELEPYSVRPDLEDLFLYSGKERPELYFDPAVRVGISSFAKLADPGEVTSGLSRLRADLDSGRFAEVAAGYPGEQGDYLIAAAESCGERGEAGH